MKQKQSSRIVSGVLSVLLLTSALLSCGETGSQNNSKEDNTSAISLAGTDPVVDDGPALEIPDIRYDGYTVNILTLDAYGDHFKLAPENDGDTLNDAGYQRNLALFDRLGVEISVTEMNDPPAELKRTVMSGDTTYDYVFPHAFIGVASMVTDNLLYDWNSLDTVDFSKPWWNQRMTDSLGIGGKLYYASGDIVIAWQGMLAILFNKSYLNGMDLEKDLYQTVFDGEWTLDYQNTLIKGVSKDLDGDGKWTDADQYGLLENRNVGYGYMYASDQRVTTTDEDGYPVLALNTERMIQIVDKYYQLIYSGEVFLDEFSSISYPTSTYRSMLLEGRSFLTDLDVGSLYPYLREIEFDFGILPLAKLDEQQEHYSVFCGAGLIGIPQNTPDPARSAAIAEAMAYYSYKYIRPAFFGIVLENKAVRDENSYKVLQMMHENKIFDFGFNFDSNASAYNMLKAVVIDNKSTDFASYYQKNEKKVLKAFDKIINACKDN